MPRIETIDKILQEQKTLFLRKLADYGTEDMTKVGVEGATERMMEKLLRAQNILRNERMGMPVNYESLRDTYLDIMGYSIIAMMLKDGVWEDEDGARPYGMDTLVLVNRTDAAKKFDLPKPKKEGDCGYDLYTVMDTIIESHQQLPTDVPTGTRVKLPRGKWALVINRSSTPRKLGIEVVPGVIDNGYTGELFACCFNRTGRSINIPAGTRLAQFIIMDSYTPGTIEVDKLPDTERGESGFGSTDK